MTNLLVGALVVGGIAVVMVALVLLAVRVRRSGRAGAAIGSAMAAYDEAMNSTAHDTFVEVQAQADRKVPIPAPDDL